MLAALVFVLCFSLRINTIKGERVCKAIKYGGAHFEVTFGSANCLITIICTADRKKYSGRIVIDLCVHHSNSEPLCVEFARCPCVVCVGSSWVLQLPPQTTKNMCIRLMGNL